MHQGYPQVSFHVLLAEYLLVCLIVLKNHLVVSWGPAWAAPVAGMCSTQSFLGWGRSDCILHKCDLNWSLHFIYDKITYEWICSDMMFRNRIAAERNWHQVWITIANYLWKWDPVYVLSNPLGVQTITSGANEINTIAADPLAHCVTKPSAAMLFTVMGKQILIFHQEGFQVPAPSQCLELIENANVILPSNL